MSCRHNCYRDGETGDLYCPAFGGWQIGGCPLERNYDLDDDENENERNEDDE